VTKRRTRRRRRRRHEEEGDVRRSPRLHKGSRHGKGAHSIPIEGLEGNKVSGTPYPKLKVAVGNFGIETWLPDPGQDLNAVTSIIFSKKGRKGRLWRYVFPLCHS
jgi:hypothetical protein